MKYAERITVDPLQCGGLVTFLIDAQLPPSLARALNAAGHPTQHVAMVGLRSANDDAVWQYAMGNGLALLTKNDDFIVRRLLESSGPWIVWLRIDNWSNRQLLAGLLPVLPEIVSRLQERDIVVEVI